LLPFVLALAAGAGACWFDWSKEKKRKEKKRKEKKRKEMYEGTN